MSGLLDTDGWRRFHVTTSVIVSVLQISIMQGDGWSCRANVSVTEKARRTGLFKSYF
nr:MAG TPA: hypothetical protein [Bacteriophage sp.]